jgi:uncharacterized RDD family membrane protein YckC
MTASHITLTAAGAKPATPPGTLVIRTPEGIAFSLTLAGPVTRFLAWGVDVGVILGLTMAIGTVVGLFGLISTDLAQAINALIFFAIQFGYRMATEWLWRGQTVGKRLLRLRVVDESGLRLHLSQIIMRNLLRAVDFLPLCYIVGGTACLLSQRAQRLGDLAAGTIVIRDPVLTQPDLDQLLAGKYNSLREHPHLAARLRQRVSPGEASVALLALLRRDELDPAARVALLGELAAHFRAKVEFPAEAVEGVTDEQYVRNAVDVIYRSRSGTAKSGAAREEDPLQVAS